MDHKFWNGDVVECVTNFLNEFLLLDIIDMCVNVIWEENVVLAEDMRDVKVSQILL